MYRHHGKQKEVPKEDAQPQNVQMACQVQGCTFQTTVFSNLCVHLKSHIRDCKKVTCSYIGCNKYFRVKSSFSSHLSRYHKCTEKEPQCHNAPASQHEEQCSLPDMLFPQQGAEQDVVPDQRQFLTNMALFYLKLQAKMLLPATTTNHHRWINVNVNLLNEYLVEGSTSAGTAW